MFGSDDVLACFIAGNVFTVCLLLHPFCRPAELIVLCLVG